MNIELLASDLETPEYEFAIALKTKFESWLKNRNSKNDRIIIAPNMRIYGGYVRDIDVFVFGILDKGVKMDLYLPNKLKEKTENVYINSFCFAIDIRSENIDNISKIDNDIFITINGRKSNFSVYNCEIFKSIRKFIKYCTSDEINIPFISTCLLFNIYHQRMSVPFIQIL